MEQQAWSSMDGSWRDLVLKHLAPGLGAVIAFIMFISPLSAVQSIRSRKSLGDFNPLPLIAIIANCTAWLVYGCVAQDIYVIAANEPGLLLGFFMATSTLGFAEPKVKENMIRALLFFASVISLTGVVISLYIKSADSKLAAAGYLAVFVLLCYYAAPLSVLWEVLRTRSSASLYWPLSVMSCINGTLWVTYGLAVSDNFIMVPNLVGACLGLIQLALIGIFPIKSKSRRSSSDDQNPLLDNETPPDPRFSMLGGASSGTTAAGRPAGYK